MIGKIIGIGLLLFVCFAGWQLGGMLSSDAFGLALGVVLGLMAGIPAALIAMSADKSVRHDVFHHAETPQNAVERIYGTSVLNSPRVTVLANPGVALLAEQARQRLEVEEF